ncbi:unnamed protein product, partial [marine sediment metagenome]
MGICPYIIELPWSKPSQVSGKTIVPTLIEVDDSHWEEAVLTIEDGHHFFAAPATSRIETWWELEDLPEETTVEDIISAVFKGEHIYYDAYLDEQVTEEFSIDFLVFGRPFPDQSIIGGKIIIPVVSPDATGVNTYSGAIYITYWGKIWVVGSHEETTYVIVIVRATDPASI